MVTWELVTFLKEGFHFLEEICWHGEGPLACLLGCQGEPPSRRGECGCVLNYKFSLTHICFPHPSLCVSGREASGTPLSEISLGLE